MYERFFGLRERPFDLTPNPRYLYLTGRHREALSNLQYGITGRKGITLLVGEAGTGKTTVVRAAMEAIAGPALRCVYLSNPALTRDEFYEFLAPRFGLSDRAAASKARFVSDLEEVLAARVRSGGVTALIIDEAQSMSLELLEEVRLLANFETETEKLLPVVLAGQPELAARLEHDALRQLKQRVALRCDLSPLTIRETAAYVSGRIAIAGGQSASIFTREAVQAIYGHSRGIPRTISVICDNALVTGFATGVKPVGASIVLEVCRDFNFPPNPQVGVGVVGQDASAAATGTSVELPPAEAAALPRPVTPAAADASVPPADQAAPENGHGRLPAVARAFTPPSVSRVAPSQLTGTPLAPAPRRAEDAPAPQRPGAAAHQHDQLFSMFRKKKRFGFF